MANLNTKYLDYDGLTKFLSKLQEYIANRISEINGTNLYLNASGTNNPTITSQINDLWGAIGTTDGEGGTIVENIEKILGEYVKKIQEPTTQDLPLKIQITEGTNDNKGRFTIGLVNNGLTERFETIESSYVKSIKTSNTNTGTQYVAIEPKDKTTEDVEIKINDTKIREKFTNIDNYTVNGKQISTNPVLSAEDIKVGIGIDEAIKADTKLSTTIDEIVNRITALGKVVNLKGVYTKWEDYTGTPENGDFVIVGNKEYVYWNGWVELGDTTQVTQYLNDLINKYNSHTHSFTPTGTVTSTFKGAQNTTSSNGLTISYAAGKLTIKSAHTHTMTPTGTVTSTFNGGGGTSGPTGSTQSLPPVEPSAPDSFNPGGGEGTTDYSKEYFTIEALEDGLTASLSINACKYRIDNGDWTTLSAGTNTPSINKGQTLSFKGNLMQNSGKSSWKVEPGIGLGIGTFTISKNCNLKGNIMSLLYGDDFEGQNDLTGKDHVFFNLFDSCKTIVDASELILPATILADGCYSSMFNMCTSLVGAPELPATTLANNCYHYMFQGCTNLTTAPELPATTLVDYCYSYMFDSCTSLTTAPSVLPATTLVDYCYYYMFAGCSKLNKITMLATDVSTSSCLYNWVNGVSSTGTFIKHPNMTSLLTGTSGIPSGWTVQDYQG